MTSAAADERPVHRRLGALAAGAAVGIVLGIAVGWILLTLTRPSDDELQRAVLEEVGLPADLEAAPVIGPALDTYTDRVESRVLDETRPSATLALVVGVIVGVVTGTVGASAAGPRTRSTQHHRSHDSKEMAHGRHH